MRAGKLRHLVRAIQKIETGRDDHGQVIPADQDVVTFWADVQPLRGAELFEARQVMPETSHLVTCRSQPKLAARMRIEFEGRDLELMEPPRDIDERGIEQEFLCKERI